MKKGFTLIELIATIIVLGIIAIITFPVISNSLKESKEKAYDRQIDAILQSARNWAAMEGNLSKTSVTSVGLSTLYESGYLKDDDGVIYNPMNTTEVLDGCVIINYSDTYNQYIYEYSDDC